MRVEWLVAALPLLVFLLGYLAGKWVERRHLRSLDVRESDLSPIRFHAIPLPSGEKAFIGAHMVAGEAVIVCDPFKRLAMQLKLLIGGEILGVERVVQRARREATVRMLEQARALGAREVVNVRYATSNILGMSRQTKRIGGVICAYGTALIEAGGPEGWVQP